MKHSFAIIIILFFFNANSQNQIKINSNWFFKSKNSNNWLKATVPGTVHTDLLNNKQIEDPFYRDNETRLQWISKVDWEYKTTFSINKLILTKKNIELTFEGLDTYCEVFLNNQLILKANNMFRTWRVDIKPLLKETNNELFIHFLSPDRIADSLAIAELPITRPSENNRHYIRKAQYSFGWDWGPKLTTSGIWRPITLNAFDMKETEFSPINIWNTKFIQEKDSIGTSFYFKINGKPTFMKGANWIPCDVFLPRITKKIYRERLIAAKEAGFNMLRVWGGGIYEDDYFYRLCDSLQIYVWQDFMFACAMYPASPDFLENVKQEVIDNIKRLRKHPCIVLWCGNNEIDEGWNNWWWYQRYTKEKGDSLWSDYKKIFYELLPNLVKQYDSRPYITTSPAIGYAHPESLTQGDSHYWGVWVMHEPIEMYAKKIPRFASEYGMQAMPNWETVKQYSLPKDWDTSSATMKVHQKHPFGYPNLAIYLKQNKLDKNKNFKEFVEATQELQSRALEIAISAHIKNKPRCMGTLFWQLNDCWPVASWSVIDYYGRKKKAYYTVKKLYTAEK